MCGCGGEKKRKKGEQPAVPGSNRVDYVCSRMGETGKKRGKDGILSRLRDSGRVNKRGLLTSFLREGKEKGENRRGMLDLLPLPPSSLQGRGERPALSFERQGFCSIVYTTFIHYSSRESGKERKKGRSRVGQGASPAFPSSIHTR